MFIQHLWSQDPAAGHIHFIILNQAAGWTKFDLGPDLARGPDFGHAWLRALLPGVGKVQLVAAYCLCAWQPHNLAWQLATVSVHGQLYWTASPLCMEHGTLSVGVIWDF